MLNPSNRDDAPADAPRAEPSRKTAPTIVHATFQAALHNRRASSPQRRARRERMRASILPPGFVTPVWAVAKTFRYYVERPGSEEHYEIPRGFEFDGASTPWPLTLIVPKAHPQYLAAAAVHDWLYHAGGIDIPRVRADAIFFEAMLVLGTNWFWAAVIRRFVRAGGWMTWYRREPDTLPGRFLRLPAILHLPLGHLWSVGLGILGVLCVDVWNLAEYRRQARAISRMP